ncbi:putrescine ABC transporter permease PotH, partial [Burkholderia sp. Bp8963]
MRTPASAPSTPPTSVSTGAVAATAARARASRFASLSRFLPSGRSVAIGVPF